VHFLGLCRFCGVNLALIRTLSLLVIFSDYVPLRKSEQWLRHSCITLSKWNCSATDAFSAWQCFTCWCQHQMMSDAFYSANNSILKRSLTRIGLPSALDPVSMINDGRRQDAWLWAPWCSGLSLVLDTTVVNTFAQGQYKHYTRGLVSQPQKLRPQNAKIPWPPNKLPLSTSGNGDHWCVWEVHFPFFEWSYKETCWCVWRPQGAPLAVVRGSAASMIDIGLYATLI